MVSNQLITFALAAFFLSLGLTLVIYKFSSFLGWTSKPDFRRKNAAVPLLGGVAVFMSAMLVSFISGNPLTMKLLIVAAPVFVVGVLDDIMEFTAKYKFVAQFASLGLWLYLTPVGDLLLSKIGLPPALSIAITCFWLIGVMNATNMIDGMDGQASIFAVIGFATLAMISTSAPASTLLLFFSMAYLGFAYWNFYPAKIYLGDSGAHIIGLILGIFSATLDVANISPAHILVPLFIFAFPEIDAILAIARRVRLKTSPFSGDHDHIHHKLLKVGLSTRQAWVVVTTVSLYAAGVAFMISLHGASMITAFLAVSATVILLGVLYLIMLMQQVLSLRAATIGESIIKEALSLSSEPSLDQSYRVTLYDLEPYYQDLQKQGIAEMRAFILDFAEFVAKVHVLERRIVQNSVSSLAVYEASSDLSVKFKREVITEFFSLLERHSLRKNATDIPWGLKFYMQSAQVKAISKQHVS